MGPEGPVGPAGPAGEQGPAGVGDTLVRKTGAESVSDSTVLQDDDHLVLALGPGEAWTFDAMVFCGSGSSTPDIKFAFTAPAGAMLTWVSDFREGTTLSNNALITESGTSVNNALTAGSTGVIRVQGVVTNGDSAGSLRFQWCQNSPSGSATRVLPGSFIRAAKFPEAQVVGQAAGPAGGVALDAEEPAAGAAVTADAAGGYGS